MTTDDTGRHPWPSHAPGIKARLSSGHGAGSTSNGGRKPTAAERNQAKAIRAAIARGEPVTPAMRMSAGYDDLATTTTEEN
jgi:hypothetical protein